MKNLNQQPFTKYRQAEAEKLLWGGCDPMTGGVFIIPSLFRIVNLRVIASNGDGWDHVSVSTLQACPTWEEMDQIKCIFFRNDEVAMQLHVAIGDHINCHPYCLHLWRPHALDIPLPPKKFVA